jgi:hypothetical protein
MLVTMSSVLQAAVTDVLWIFQNLVPTLSAALTVVAIPHMVFQMSYSSQ